MSIKIGTADPSAIKIGSADAKAVYAGTELVWPLGPSDYTEAVGGLKVNDQNGSFTSVVHSNGPTGCDITDSKMTFHFPLGSNNLTLPFDWYYTINYSPVPAGGRLSFGLMAVEDGAMEAFPTYKVATNGAGLNNVLAANHDPGSSYYSDINGQYVYTDNLKNGGTWTGKFRKTYTWPDSGYSRLGFRFSVTGRMQLNSFSIRAEQSFFREGDEELAREQEEFQRKIDEVNQQIEEALLNG